MACRPPRHARSPTAPPLTLLAARLPAATALARAAAALAARSSSAATTLARSFVGRHHARPHRRCTR